MEKVKLRMSNKVITRIWASVVAVLLCVVIVATAVMNYYKVSLNNYLGKGERIINAPEAMDGWDTNYYEQKFGTIKEAREENSANVALEIAQEGIALLKNDGVLPLNKGDEITPFGLRYMEPLYGGTGSGNVDISLDYISTPQEVMNEYFVIDSVVASKLEAGTHYYLPAPESEGETPSGWQASQPKTKSEVTIFENHTWMDEYNPDEVYDEEFLAAANGTTAIIFIGRVGGESNDLYHGQFGGYADGTEHILQLNGYEKQTIKMAKESCEKVIVVLETSNVMEISELALADGELSVDAIIWMGGAGAKGFQGLGDILAGEVNPSGHLPDTWMASIDDDPVSTNFGEYLYSNLTYNEVTQAMVEYDEGVYMGYRYYETVYDLSDKFLVNGEYVGYGELVENGTIVTAGAVVYPFGYGLSYDTDFVQEIKNVNETDDQINLTVKVTNNGTKAGKAVAQIYYTAPYTDLDIEYGIEKSTVNLAAYAKTGVIGGNGGSEEVQISFAKEDMASYCYTYETADGTKGCYMLEEGDYLISVRNNSHEVYDSVTVKISDTIWYDGSDKDHIRQSEIDAQDTAGGGSEVIEYIAATNQFQENNDHMSAKTDRLTRASGVLDNTAEPPAVDDLTAPDGMLEAVNTLEYFDPETDELLGNVEGSAIYAAEEAVTNAKANLTAADLRGIPYDDPKWDELMNQLDLRKNSDVWQVLLSSAYAIGEIKSIEKPATTESDGPQGISAMFGAAEENGCAWCSAPILAATFNVELAYKMGEAIGQEGLSKGVSAWYAPGLNTHRSPFSGRNFEYYSEDPILAGITGARVVSGAADNGVSGVIKHLFLNDMETARNHIATWCDEQAMREIYLKAFEIAIKEAVTELEYIADDQGTTEIRTVRATAGIMTSMGSIGSIYCGTNYNLCTNVLRGEMGFRGLIQTDMAENENNSKDMMIRSGVNEYMYFTNVTADDLKDYKSPTAQAALGEAVKGMSYMVVNSSAMQGIAPGSTITYKLAPWQKGLVAGYVVVFVFAVIITVIVIRRRKHAAEHPEMYKH